MTKINSSSITEQCYRYMIDNDIKKLNIYDFLDYIKSELNIQEEDYATQMSYFYTDLNLDGRFVCVEDGSWVLKDTLSVEDVLNYTEPSISKLEIEDIEEIEEDEEVRDDIDNIRESEEDEEENSDYYEGYEKMEITSKYGINPEEEDF